MYFFFAGLRKKLKNFFFVRGPCPHAGAAPLDQVSVNLVDQVSVNGIFCKARLRCFPARRPSLGTLLNNVKYEINNNSKTKNRGPGGGGGGGGGGFAYP